MDPKRVEELFLKWAYVWSVGQEIVSFITGETPKVTMRQQAQQLEQSLLKNRRIYE